MKIFTIDTENNIAVHESAELAQAVENAESFRDEKSLAKLAAEWPGARLVDVWNSLPGVTPVKKFTNRQTAVNRIWKAIQNLGDLAPAVAQPAETEHPEPEETCVVEPETPAEDAVVAPQARDVAEAEAGATPKTSRAKRARAGATDAEGSSEIKAPRGPNKTDIVLAFLKREGGVTVQELMDATGWQAHSVRGFLSGTIGKKMALPVISAKEDGVRKYSLQA